MAVLCILFSLVSHTHSGDDRKYNDFVLRNAIFMLRAIAMLLLLTWLLYLLTSRFLFSTLFTWLHVLSTTAITIGMAVLLFRKIMNNAANHLQQISEKGVDSGNPSTFLPTLGILIFFAQMIFIINLMIGIIKRLN